MAIDPTTSATTATTQTSATAKKDPSILGKDDFLKILVGQLQNMDPMSQSGNDPTQSMQQMTQFSILEQLTNLSTSQQAMAQSEKQSQSLALLGKTVSYTDSADNSLSGLVKNVDFGKDGAIKLTLESGATITPADVTGVQ